MSTTQVRSDDAGGSPSVKNVDLKLEVVVIPVSDVDRSKAFYEGIGWRLDADIAAGDAFHVVQFTPPGSACSVAFGKNISAAAPGSAQDIYLVVADIEAARSALVARGVDVSQIFYEGKPGVRFHNAAPHNRVSGHSPNGSYWTFATFSDPDGNGWLLQEVTTRRPGRIDPAATSFGSTSDLAGALRRAAAAHGEHEKRTGEEDADWPGWYADYMVREQAGGDELAS